MEDVLIKFKGLDGNMHEAPTFKAADESGDLVITLDGWIDKWSGSYPCKVWARDGWVEVTDEVYGSLSTIRIKSNG